MCVCVGSHEISGRKTVRVHGWNIDTTWGGRGCIVLGLALTFIFLLHLLEIDGSEEYHGYPV